MQVIVDIFVNSVFLYDDRLAVSFNWKDGTKTVSLAEYETAAENEASVESLNLSHISSSYLDDNVPVLGTKKAFAVAAPLEQLGGLWLAKLLFYYGILSREATSVSQ